MNQPQFLGGSGLIVVCRRDYFGDARFAPPPITPSVPLQKDEVMRSHRGIDGDAWLLQEPDFVDASGLASISDFDKALDFYISASAEHLCDFIYISRDADLLPDSLASRGFYFLGYDFGMYLSQWNNYSSLFHEVMYGSIPEMRWCASKLNSSLLLPSLQDVMEVAGTRARFEQAESGRRLESIEAGECLGPLRISGMTREQAH